MKTRKIRTLVIISSELSHNRALSSRALHITNELSAHGISTELIGVKTNDDSEIKAENIIAVKKLPNNLFGKLLTLMNILITTLFEVTTKRVNIVIIRGYDLVFLAIFLKSLGVIVVYDFHGYRYLEQISEGNVIRAKYTKIIENIIIKLVNQIIVVSEGTSDQLFKKLEKKVILLPNGVDLELFQKEIASEEKDYLITKYKLPKNKKIIVFVGTFQEWFDLDELIDILKFIDHDIYVLLIGDGNDYYRLKDKTRNSDKITMTGRIPHGEAIKILIGIAHVCVIPYKRDWFGASHENFFSSRKILEYLAAGKPIIASNIRGIPNFLIPGKNVLLYEPGNSNDLACKIDTLLNDEHLYKALSENNKQLADEFSWEILIKKSGLLSILGE